MPDIEMQARLSELPDYPAIRDIQRALWGAGEVRGAAVMVGAGFSRNAQRATATAPIPPLWSNFAARMAADLYPSAPTSAPTDPLRLAEEYRSALGQPALEALIRELVPDAQWLPGPLHRDLLSLPWADVLTVNWDTLLERAAAADHERTYELVETVNSIARTRPPRIVKLHGSLPSHAPFIFTEEDFRTYPQRFAPFVNLAQQVLLENDLCLLGFSGDDPNFLQWAGWVRDQLGASARRIRLVGVLNLSTSRRRLLEGQNVTPIDLGPLVEHLDPADRHRVATEVFLCALKDAKPAPAHKWSRPSDSLHEDLPLTELLDIWSGERISYPGWLLAPSVERYRVRFATERYLHFLANSFEQEEANLRSRISMEIVWRCNVALWGLPDWLALKLPDLLDDHASAFSREERIFLWLALATHARELRDSHMLEAHLESATKEAVSADEIAAVAYERCLWARDSLDYLELAKSIPLLVGSDPTWKLRRASMLAELREPKEAAILMREALLDIRTIKARDRKSLWLLSREAWAHMLHHINFFELPKEDRLTDDDWPQRYAEAHCDPWDELRHWDHDYESARDRVSKRAQEDDPGYNPGFRRRYKTPREGWTSSAITEPFLELSRLIDLVGIARMPHSDLVESRLGRAIELMSPGTSSVWGSIRSLHDSEKGLINRGFNRVAVALLDQEIVEDVISRLRSAVDYGRARLLSNKRDDDGELRSSDWVERVRIFTELLSRLVVRVSPDNAIEIFRWGTSLAHDPNWSHWWLFEPLSNLLKRTLDTIPPEQRAELAFDIINLPLPGEFRGPKSMERYWPELSQELDDSRIVLTRSGIVWEARIAAIIEQVRNPYSRTRAILAALTLSRKGILSGSEKQALAAAVWSQIDEANQLPGGTQLLPHVFLELPEPELGKATAAFRYGVIEEAKNGSASDGDLQSLAYACKTSDGWRMSLARVDALKIADTLLAWKPPKAGEARAEAFDRGDAIGRVLADAVLPVLNASDLKKRADRLFALVEESGITGPLEALPRLVTMLPAIEGRALEHIRRALASRAPEIVFPAMSAVARWIQLAERDGVAFPPVLAREVASLCGMRREPALFPALQMARKLVIAGLATEEDQDRLVEALELLAVETDYATQDEGDFNAMSLTLVRKECVRLADALANAGRQAAALKSWVEKAPGDPIPEVRYALFEPDDT